ncbi:5-carboxymethyl-2-hydroxymuconate Delta-isomerase [Xanthobacter sp. TB0136]|uniref:5-carboxymethyl-2-hydroxymuconate Delta-isomerase n=1 Tax=Xanthobacter sp. TB0136 TaxID=3459177 RepID=UPI004039528F
MPHLTVEYSSNIGHACTPQMLRNLNTALMTSGQFEEMAIKSRAVPVDVFAIGTAEGERGFLAARLCILSGRTAEQKKQLSEILLEALKKSFMSSGIHTQITVEILDMDRASYGKAIFGP